MKNRGFHNLMQRRAQFRSPGPPPRVRAGGRASMPAPAKKPLRQKVPPPYQHRHMRPARDLPEFIYLAERLERLPRNLERLRRRWEKRLGYDPLRGRYGPPPERRARRDPFGTITTTTVDIRFPPVVIRIHSNTFDTNVTTATGSLDNNGRDARFASGW